MIERDDLASVALERVPTGVPGPRPDPSWRPLCRRRVHCCSPPPGSGKTILGNQISFHHVAQGGRTVYVTLLTESHARLLATIQQLAFLRTRRRSAPALKYFTAYNAFEQDQLRGLLTLLKQIVREHRATLLVIDGLVVSVPGAEADVEKKKFIHELQVYVELVGCTTILLTGAGQARPTSTPSAP